MNAQPRTTTPHKRATGKSPTPAHPLTPREIWRQEVAAADRRKHEDAYFLHVVCPLVDQGYPRPRAQALLVLGRRYRYDWAFYEAKLAIEINGQIWQKGGHTSGYGITRDAEKLDELAAVNWRELIITPEMIASGYAKDVTERALRAAGLRSTR